MFVQEVTLKEAQDAVINTEFVVIKLYSQTCAPCKALLPALESVSDHFEPVRVVKLDADGIGVGDFLKEFGIRGVPTLLFYNGGAEIFRNAGYAPASKLKELFQRLTE